MSTKFHDRKEAGLLLAERLKVYVNLIIKQQLPLAQKKQW